MIEVIIRHATWEEGKKLGEFLPSEIKNLVDLINEFGVCTEESNEDLSEYTYYDASFDVDKRVFEIIVD